LETLNFWLNVLKVAVGLGFVIFLHELGHFLLAKWNGVKVEKFSIGFGPTLFGFRRGETEYVLAAIPLGGFVKMLGEGPEDEANKSSDPRAYPNKSVGARMAIISAGVLMNLLLGLVCFVYAYGQGMDEIPAKIGAVVAGSPAYAAGIRTGDEIVAIDGRDEISYADVTRRVRLSGAGQVVHLLLKRPGRRNLIPLEIEPRRDRTADMPGIGILPSSSLITANPPYRAPAGLAEPPQDPLAGFRPGDQVVAIGPVGASPEPVATIDDLHRLLARFRDQPVEEVVARGDAHPERVSRTLPSNRFVDFGFRLTIEPISGIQGGSPAEAAGFQKGDRIVKVDGRDDFDPMRLPSLCQDRAGHTMTFEVERVRPGQPPQTVTLTVTPDATPPWTEYFLPNEPLEVAGLGLCYPVRTRIVAVAPDSPAARAGLKVGDVISSMTIPPPAEKPKDKSEPFDFAEDGTGWPSAFAWLQLLPRRDVMLTVNNADRPVAITPEPVSDWFHPLRGVQLRPLIRRLPPQSPAAALWRGLDDTVDNVLSIYAMFRSLAQRRVSPKLLGGPILIAQAAYDRADSGLTDFIHFLGFLSINLAVLNFLPIPPLDGGQMAFLIAEKVRGRPLPDSALIAGTYLGLVLVLCLMAFAMFQDVYRLVTG
jgi:regulator of sigma E protease